MTASRRSPAPASPSGRPRRSAEVATALAIGLAGLGVRALVLWQFGGPLDADNVTIGLMARHILEGRHYAFFWGQAYMGSVEAYVAAMFFALFGAGDLQLQLAPLVATVGFGAAAYGLARRLWGPAVALVTLGWLALGPPALTLWSLAPRAGYVETLALGTAGLLLAVRIAEGPSAGQRHRWAALGLVAGLALWTHLLGAVYLAAAAAYLLIADWRVVARRGPWIALATTLVGSLPLWSYNLRHGFATFTLLTPGEPVELGDNLAMTLAWNVPHLLGARSLTGAHGLLPGPIAAVLLVVPLVALVRVARGTRGTTARRWPPPALVPGLLVAATLLAVLLTPYGRVDTTRYLVPLYAALPLVVAVWLVCHLPRPLALAVGGLLGIAHLYGHLTFEPLRTPDYPALAAALRAAGVRHAYAEYWTAAPLTYYSGETLIVADLAREWYPLAERPEFTRPAVIRSGPDPAMADALELAGVEMVERAVGGVAVYVPAAIRGEPRRGLSRERFRIVAWPNGGEAEKAVDGNLATRWHTAEPQRAGMWVLVDLGEEAAVSGVRLDLGPYTADFPRTVAVDVSRDGVEWATVAATRGYYRPGVLVGRDTFRFHATFLQRLPSLRAPINSPDVRFATVAARFVKIRLPRPPDGELTTGAEWSIAELWVFGPAAP